jgi:hypothetical protein
VLPTPSKTFRPDQQKIRPLAKKFGPPQNLLTNANISVFNTLFLSAKGPKIKNIIDEVYFSADILGF